MSPHLSPRALVRLAAGLALALVYVVPQQAQSTPPSSQPCAVSGLVQSGSLPLRVWPSWRSAPTVRRSRRRRASRTAATCCGSPRRAPIKIKASLAAFAPSSREATLTAGDCTARVDIALTLASRVPAALTARRIHDPASGSGALRQARAGHLRQAQGRRLVSGRGTRAGLRARWISAARRRHQRDRRAGSGGDCQTRRRRLSGPSSSCRQDFPLTRRPRRLPPPAFRGNRTMRCSSAGGGGRGEFGEGGPEGLGRGGEGGFGGGGDQGGFGGGVGGGRGGGPGGGGFGGPGGPGGFGGMRGGGRIQGNANYNLGGSMFDAAPYTLNGRVREEPDYVQQRYGTSFGGPLTIPHIFNGGHTDVVLPELLRQPLSNAGRFVLDGADAGGARRRLFQLERGRDRSADRSAVPRQQHPAVARSIRRRRRSCRSSRSPTSSATRRTSTTSRRTRRTATT